jgi:DNA polymerase-3 subunit gamma/tau
MMAVRGQSMAGESQSLYRTYRPRSFSEDELVGQEAVARTLRNAIQSGRVAHAYLFCGPRGTGKTSTARLLAKAVNCQHPDPAQRPCNACAACQAIGLTENRSMDIIEIDAASNRGIDDIRELRDRIAFAPSELTYKFYIIDEVHQLSEAAANALLKTLEEPPRHAKFVLATTDPQKMLETIVSRCQVFRFRRIPLDRMVARLQHVCQTEGVAADDEALALIARQATGSLRDALGLLDTVIAYGDERVTTALVQQALGIHGDERVIALADAALAGDLAGALSTVGAAIDAGFEPRLFTQQAVDYLRELLLRLAGGAPIASGLAPLRDAAQARQAAGTTLPVVADLVHRLSAIDYALERGAYGALPLELALIEAGLARDAVSSSQAAVQPVVEPRPVARPRPVAPASSERDRSSTAPAAPMIASEPPGLADSSPSLAAEGVSPTPIAVAPVDASSPTPAVLHGEALADLWQRVLRDLNAHHKKAYAMLREAAPLLIDGDTLILVASYEFHYKQINQDDLRGVIEVALARAASHEYRVRCILASEADHYRAQLADQPPAPEMPAEPPLAVLAEPAASETELLVATSPPSVTTTTLDSASPMLDRAAADRIRAQAVMNIFGARPVERS